MSNTSKKKKGTLYAAMWIVRVWMSEEVDGCVACHGMSDQYVLLRLIPMLKVMDMTTIINA